MIGFKQIEFFDHTGKSCGELRYAARGRRGSFAKRRGRVVDHWRGCPFVDNTVPRLAGLWALDCGARVLCDLCSIRTPPAGARKWALCVRDARDAMVATGISAAAGWRFISVLGGAAALIFAICWVIADRSARPALAGPSRGKMAFYCCIAYFGYSYCLGEILFRNQALFQSVAGLSALISGVLMHQLK